METLDYISQQLGQLKIVKTIPDHVNEDHERLTNRGIDVRPVCIVGFLAAQLNQDATCLGFVSKVLKTLLLEMPKRVWQNPSIVIVKLWKV